MCISIPRCFLMGVFRNWGSLSQNRITSNSYWKKAPKLMNKKSPLFPWAKRGLRLSREG